MATITKLPLSASSNGKSILIAGTSGSATEVHTAVTGTTDFDEVWLYATNNATSSISCSILWGEDGAAGKTTAVISPQQGRTLIVDGRLLQNSLVIKSYADITNTISIDGFINRITA